MPVYAFKGLDQRGRPVQGTRDADSPKTLRANLRRDGVLVTEVGAAKVAAGARPAGTGAKAAAPAGAGFFSGVKAAEIAAFTRQLATLLRAGIVLAEALGILAEQNENPRFKSMLSDVREHVNQGSSLADALGRHPGVFEEVFVSMVRAGETAGNLDQILDRLAAFLEGQVKLRSKVISALVYPVFMMVLASAVVAVLMVTVIPQVTQMYEDTEKTLPWNTQLLIAAANFLGGYWFLWIPGIFLAGFGFVAWKRSRLGRPVWDAFTLRLPLVGRITRLIAVGRFARTFGTMLAGGVPMLRALDVARSMLGNTVLAKAVEGAREKVQQGESVAVTLRKTGQFPPLMTHMIAVGERSGQLEGMLENVAAAYETEAEMTLARLTTILEPVMIAVMGGTVAFVVFSILTPIMSLNPQM